MRLTFSTTAARSLAALAIAVSGARTAHAQPAGAATTQPASQPTAPPDPLGSLVVTPATGRPLPRIAVVPSLSSDLSDVVIHSVVERDLDLSGEVELLPRRQMLADTYADAPVDVVAWGKTGVVAVVTATAVTAGDKVTLTARAYLVKQGATPVLERKVTVPIADLRGESHRTSDVLIGALTGQDGGFYSRMTFTAGAGPIRAAYVVDSDGHDLRAASGPDELVIASTFGEKNELYRVSSVQNEPYRIRSTRGPVTLPIAGPVYGVAFSKDRSRVAVSIGTDAGIRLFEGRDFQSLSPFGTIAPAMEPFFTPSGKIGFSGAGKSGFRIYLEGQPSSTGARGAVKAITPDGSQASSPTYCPHPDGPRVVFAAGPGKRLDLYATSESGGGAYRLTQGGQSAAPACSPDGRLVAFFSTRTTGEGPGLYVMRLDGQRPKRISTMVGDSLRWAPIVPVATPAAAPPASASASPSVTGATNASRLPEAADRGARMTR